MEQVYGRSARPWRRWLAPPTPLLLDPTTLSIDATLGRWNRSIGSAGTYAPGYVNVDLTVMAGVNVACNAKRLP